MSKTNTQGRAKLKQTVRTIIYIGLILVTLWFVYKLFIRPRNALTGIESFEDINSSEKYGNLISATANFKSAPVYKVATKQVIRLPGRFKLTGFKIAGVVLEQVTIASQVVWLFTQSPAILFNDISQLDIQNITNSNKTYYALKNKGKLEMLYPGYSENIVGLDITSNECFALTKYIVPTFKVSLIDNEIDINNPEKHVNVLMDNAPDLQLNENYTSYKMFDNDDKTAKYVGSTLIISEIVNPGLSLRPVYLTGWSIYGLAPYAPSWADYAIMTKLNNATHSLTSSAKDINLVDNKKVYYLELIGNSLLQPIKYNITIQYKNKMDNLTNIYNVNGPVQRGFANTSSYIFFDEPIIASLVTINNSFTPGVTLNVFGVTATQNDENMFKLEQGKYDPQGMIIEGQKCPNVGQMMQKQLQAQQICEALEQKDRIRNKKASYERDKAYLKKLSEQDGEIKQLATKISGLIEKKNTRIRESSISGDAQKLDAELEKIQALRREADEYMKKSDVAALNVNVNLEPDLDLDYIKKNISV
jgi:hypothetical protein